jgi:acyl-CoA synthetase (AMP-forming)/AMP-acid ligase II
MGYTSTEAVAVVASIAGDEFLAHPTSTGRVVATVTVELRDEQGAPVPEGELGEVHVRSPYVMLGYWNDPDASAAVLKPDGWLAMGDLGRMVDDLLYIDSRARDLILVSAENVAPTEVEYCLEAHPQVLEAAVFAVDDAVTGDAVCAVVVTEPESTLTPDDLSAWCRASLAHYKVPTRWHLVHERLPRTASGKLVKDQIRTLATVEH